MIDWKVMFTIFLAIVAAGIVLHLWERHTTPRVLIATPPAALTPDEYVRRYYPNATTV